MVDPAILAVIGEPEDYPTFYDWFVALIEAEWKGADEPVQTLYRESNGEPGAVKCVCGTLFTFKAGATRARCPGCGCRYAYI